MCHHVQNIIDQVAADKWNPDIIVGVSRGGVLPAAMISHKLKARMVCLHVALRDDDDGPESNLWLPEEARDGTKILIVDDINDSGATINWIKEDWTSSVNND
jgi:hypoxanthine phosphoribosyltransferase